MEHCYPLDDIHGIEILLPIGGFEIIYCYFELLFRICKRLLRCIVMGRWSSSNRVLSIRRERIITGHRISAIVWRNLRRRIILLARSIDRWFSSSWSVIGTRILSIIILVYLVLLFIVHVFFNLNGLHVLILLHGCRFNGTIASELSFCGWIIETVLWIKFRLRIRINVQTIILAVKVVARSRCGRLQLLIGTIWFYIIVVACVIDVRWNIAEAKRIVSLLSVTHHVLIFLNRVATSGLLHIVVIIQSSLLTTETSGVIFTVGFRKQLLVFIFSLHDRIVKRFNFFDILALHFLCFRLILIFKGTLE